MIDKLKVKINEAIEKYGIHSDKVYQLSLELDEEIAKFYKEYENNSEIKNINYLKSLERLKLYIEEHNQMPTVAEWNKIAKQENFLSSESMKYIGNIKFK